MSRRWTGWVLAASLLINVGVVAAVGWRTFQDDGAQRQHFGMPHQDLPAHLGLTPEQRAAWSTLEQSFLGAFAEDARRIAASRERMIRMIFGEQPDPAAIEAARAAIFRIQEQQQRRVIEQLLKERELLQPEQRRLLAEQLLRQ